MKGCARTCLIWVVIWGAASYAFYRYFVTLGDLGDGLYWASGGAGLCIALIYGYIQVIYTSAKERRLLLEAATGTTPLTDGKWSAVSGPIHSMRPARAPLTGASVVAYDYKISRIEGSGKSRGERTYYEGKALVPSTIATRHGSVRLLSVPVFDIKAAELTKETAVRNAQDYIAATQFETSETPKEQRAGGVEKESTDDDGNFRVDRKEGDLPAEELESCTFRETHIAQNEVVCAFGIYSSQRGGLVPNPNWAYQTRIMRGDGESVANQLRKRIVRYVIGVVVFSGIAYGIVRLCEANAIPS